MPGKEAVVEVEKAVVPEPVTKEIPKRESASVDVEGKKDEDPEPAKTAETAPVADSGESKSQDAEITSSAEQKTEKEDCTSDKAEKEAAAVESTNGSAAKAEGKVVSQAEESCAPNGETKPDKSLAESKVEASEELKSSEATPKAESDVEAKSSEAKVTPDEVSAKSSEAESETKADPMETDTKTAEAVDTETTSSEAAPAEKVEKMEDDSKSSEAAAKPLPADDEKIIIEKDTKSGNRGGSDELMKRDAPQDGTKDATSEDSSSEKKPENPPSSESNSEEKPGSGSAPEVTHDLEKQISELKKKGLELYVRRDYCAAADAFGKVLEVQAPLYGEMSEKLAETYFLYGSAMYEYGKLENGVLGEQVKEKDEGDDDEEEGEEDEQMEVDEKEGESAKKEKEGESAEMEKEGESSKTAAESTIEKCPSTPSGYGEAEDAEGDKEPADVTITGEDKEDDDDAFRVAWEMLELAKSTFRKADNKKRLADTLVKLGEVGIEIENLSAMAEMEEGLKIRKEVFPANHRIISETHFNIGLAYAAFDRYDEAIQHFTGAKDSLEKRIEELSKSETKEDKAEVEEMQSLLPEIQEKINDTRESKADKERLKAKIEGELLKKAEPAKPFPTSSEDKPVSNISHLVKRKRKVDEILPERAAKQSRQEDATDVASVTTEEAESSKPAHSMEVTETEENEETKIVDKPEEQAEEMKTDSKSEEKLDAKSEEKPETKSEETPRAKTEEKPEQKSEEKHPTKTEEKPEQKSAENPAAKTDEKLEQKSEETPKEVKDVPQSEDAKPEEGPEKAAEAKSEEAKPAETETNSSEPEKMEE